MLAVLAMMTVLVYTATPSMVRLMRDRRVNRAAMQVTDYLRTARTMAIGKGQPVLVRWNASGFNAVVDTTAGTGGIEIDEPIVTTNAASSNGNCATTQWLTAATQKVNYFDLQTNRSSYTAITFFDDTGANPQYAEFCFSGTGRMYLRTGAGGMANTAFHAVLGVPAFAVFNLQNNPGMLLNINTRWVYAPPNGAARMGL
jgi:type IV fimbrial biogenesis protein FimT